MSQVHGLAGSIRNAVDSETFDLAGKNVTTIETAIRDAFREPFPLATTIRITFVTGAGKLARQKYDDGAAKAVTSVLRELGYEEDQSGGAGTFKSQHDTGKNLKTVVVHPLVGGQVEKEMAKLNLDTKSPSLLDEKTPEYKIANASMNVFERMVQTQCPTWSQKKGCAQALEGIKAILQDLDQKLLEGTPLNESEQDFYDSVSINSLEEKLAIVRELMHKHIDEGDLTAEEKSTLLAQVRDRISALKEEIDTAQKENKPKKLERLKDTLLKAEERKAKIETVASKPLPKLKNEEGINKLRKELAPLLEVEASAKGRLLSIKESQAIARKSEIEDEIERLEQLSREWFESDEEFNARVQASRKASKGSRSLTQKKTTSSTMSNITTTKWVTPAQKKKTLPSKSTSKASQTKGGGVFAAMMMDSDSD